MLLGKPSHQLAVLDLSRTHLAQHLMDPLELDLYLVDL